jgi:hypothetical protein
VDGGRCSARRRCGAPAPGVLAGDQQPVQALGPHRTDPALGVGVGVWRLYRRNQHLGAVRTEDVVEGTGELRIPITNKEAHSSAPLAQHEAQVAGLLGDPSPIRVGGHPGEVDSPSVQLDEEQHIQPPQPHRVDGEEIAGDDPGGLLAQEHPPGRIRPPWRGVQPTPTQHRPDGGGRDSDAQVLEFALDPLVAPARVLPGQADDQLSHVLVQRWSAGLVVRVGPCAGHQASVPAQQRLRPDDETGPAGSGQHAADGSEQRSVGGPEPGSSRLAAQHTELVTQDEDLQILGGVVIGEQGEELDGAAQRQVGESWQHLGAASATG